MKHPFSTDQGFALLLSVLLNADERLDAPSIEEVVTGQRDDPDIVAGFWRIEARNNRSDPEIRWNLGESLLAAGIEEEAQEAWRKCLVLRPDDPRAALRLAQFAFQNGTDAEARQWLKRILNRRPDDDALKVAVIGLCLMVGETRQARAFAEDFLRPAGLSPRLAAALFRVFCRFDDVGRAGMAACQPVTAGQDGLALRLLSAEFADWSGDRLGAVRQYAAIAEIVPGGSALARKAIAQFLAGDRDGAARTLASAVHLLLKVPEQLSDLIAMLSWPDLRTLRQIVISSLTIEAEADPAAAAALALAHYRLGDWQAAASELARVSTLPDWPALRVVAENTAAHDAQIGALPTDAADFILHHHPEKVFPVAGRPQAVQPDDRVLLLLGEEDAPGAQSLLIEAMQQVEVNLTIAECPAHAVPLDTRVASDRAVLDGCFFGAPFTPAVLTTATPQTSTFEGGFAYLPPAFVARVEAVRSVIERSRSTVVHIAGSDVALAAGLAALHAGVKSVSLHLSADWQRRGARRQSFFLSGMKRLMADPRCQVFTSVSEPDARNVDPLPEQKRLWRWQPGVDEKAIRRSSGRMHGVRAAETLGVQHQQPRPPLISLLLANDAAAGDVVALRDLLAADHGNSYVRWVWPGGDEHAAVLPTGDRSVTLRWPELPGAFLANIDVGLVVGNPRGLVLPVLVHVAMSVPLLGVGSNIESHGLLTVGELLPTLGGADWPDLPDRLKQVLADTEHRATVGEQGRLWLQSNARLRDCVRLLERYHHGKRPPKVA